MREAAVQAARADHAPPGEMTPSRRARENARRFCRSSASPMIRKRRSPRTNSYGHGLVRAGAAYEYLLQSL